MEKCRLATAVFAVVMTQPVMAWHAGDVPPWPNPEDRWRRRTDASAAQRAQKSLPRKVEGGLGCCGFG
jgi:hypothetical protein